MRFDGLLSTWNDDRGFGFIAPDQGGQEVFVHVKAFTQRGVRPQVGQRVSFEMEPGPQGKKRACRVEPVRAALRARPSVRPARHAAHAGPSAGLSVTSRAALVALLVVCGVLRVTSGLPWWVAAFYGAVSVVTYVVYAHDKGAAARGDWRTPESTLHLLALLGGWPGALVAQQRLRHKSSKVPFRVVFWGTVVANLAALVVLGPRAALMELP